MRAADQKLSRDVRKAIAKDGEVDTSRLGVVACTGKVTLVGSMPENDQIDFATQRAQSVTGVTNVASRLSIDVPGGH
jgi:hyperosmotically inducible periplasmic protein